MSEPLAEAASQPLAIPGQSADWCRGWATFLDQKADQREAQAAENMAEAKRLHADADAYRAYAESLGTACNPTGSQNV